MKAAVIINKKAKQLKNQNKDFSEKSLTNLFRSFNINSNIKIVEGKYLQETAKQMLNEDYDVIAAGGGDGTISAIASVMIECNKPLGVLPLGTLNHFAKDLNIPLNINEAIEVISKRKIKKIDVGEVNGRTFINNSSIGFYPKIVKHREFHTKKLGFNKWLAMAVAVINVFRRFHSVDVKLHSGSDTITTKTPFVFIGNNEYKTDLFNPGIRSSLSDGLLSIYFPDTTGKISMTKFAYLALLNKLNQADDFVMENSKEITIETKKKTLEVSADGEILKLDTPLKYKIKPLSIKVIIP